MLQEVSTVEEALLLQIVHQSPKLKGLGKVPLDHCIGVHIPRNTFQTLAAKEGVSVPTLLKLLGIMPPVGELEGDGFWARNNGERLPLRGGTFWDPSTAGVFALYLSSPRAFSSDHIGFRAAFVNL